MFEVPADGVSDKDHRGCHPAETVERLAALSDEDARNDPRRECSWDQVEAQRNLVRSWVGARSGEVRAFWGLP